MSGQWGAPGSQPGGGQPSGGWPQQGAQPSDGWSQQQGNQPSGGWSQQQYGHGSHPQGQPQQAGGLHLRTGFFFLAFLLYLFPPKCSIDGSPEFGIRWGDNHLPVPPGRHHVRVWFPYMFMSQCGPAETVIDVPASGMALEYKAPWFVFSKGRMLIPGYGPAPAPQPQGYGPQPAYGAQLQHAVQPAPANPAGWHSDPTGRFEQRYWDGQGWTAHVVRGGVQASDPI